MSLRFAPPAKRAMLFVLFTGMQEPHCKALVLERRANQPQCEIDIVYTSRDCGAKMEVPNTARFDGGDYVKLV